MTIVLSHTLARIVLDVLPRPHGLPTWPPRATALPEGAPRAHDIARARAILAHMGVPAHALERIDLLVASERDKRHAGGARCHVWQHPISTGTLCKLVDGIYVTDARFTALLMATELPELELIEYYFDLCARYRRSPFDSGTYADAPPLTTAAQLRAFFRAHRGMRGARIAAAAAARVSDGARSPFEVALVIPLVARRACGGLALKRVALDHRVPLNRRGTRFTRRSELYFDIFVPAGNQDVEYNGGDHVDATPHAIDSERETALRAMGYTVTNVSREQLFNPFAFQRLMLGIARQAGIRLSRLPSSFPRKLESLRRFVIRHWR